MCTKKEIIEYLTADIEFLRQRSITLVLEEKYETAKEFKLFAKHAEVIKRNILIGDLEVLTQNLKSRTIEERKK